MFYYPKNSTFDLSTGFFTNTKHFSNPVECNKLVISDNLQYFLTETLITTLNVSTEAMEMDSLLNAIEGSVTFMKQLSNLLCLITNIFQNSRFC